MIEVLFAFSLCALQTASMQMKFYVNKTKSWLDDSSVNCQLGGEDMQQECVTSMLFVPWHLPQKIHGGWQAGWLPLQPITAALQDVCLCILFKNPWWVAGIACATCDSRCPLDHICLCKAPDIQYT